MYLFIIIKYDALYILVCAIILYNEQHRFVYSSSTTNAGVMQCSTRL